MRKFSKISVVTIFVILCVLLFTACSNVSFKVDFMVDGEVYATIDTTGNEEIKMPANPSKDDYIFDGWFWDKDEWDKPFTANSLLDEPLSDDMAVHAKWLTETKYTITFESNWDIVIPAITDHGGKAITAPTISTRDGYDFGGWYTDAECKNPFDFSFMPQSNTTLYAKWTANTANEIYITFQVDDAEYEKVKTSGNEMVSIPNNPTKNGHVFSGWYWADGKAFTVNSLLTTPISSSMTVYAKWVTEASYTLTFVTSGGESVDAVSFHGGAAITQPTPTRDGYIFAGWYIDNGTFANKPNFNSMPANNLTVYAKWTANNADPYISINGGTVNGTDLYIEVEYTATQLDLSAIISVASGASWELYKDITGSEKIPTKYASSLRNGNNIYYVVVTTNQGEVNRTYKLNIYRNHHVTMTFVSVGSTYTTEQVLTHTTMGDGPEIARMGYTFDGWGCNGHYVTAAKTFTAAWMVCPVTLTKNINSAGTVDGVEKTVIGEQTTITATTNSGYTWLGWYDGETKVTDNKTYTFTMPLESKTYEARWMLCPITLEKNINKAGTVTGVEKTVIGEQATITATTNSGYTWLGWYDGTTKVTDNKAYTFIMPSKNKTYIATWYKLGVEKNLSAAGTVTDLTSTYNVGDGASITATTNSGYTWLGWYDGTTKVTDNKTYTFTMPSKNKTYTAKWKANQATISFDANGGTGAIPSQTISSGEILPANTFIAADSDYSFLGWSTSSDGAVIYHDQDVYTVESDREQRTLYAVWVQYTRVGNYIWFGEYPQTIKSNDVTITETINSRGYYLGSDGNYYAKVTATPNNSSYKFSTNASVSSGTVYYFKVEPIKWRILSESDGTALILCESIIANKRYNEYYSGTKNGVYANNYKESEIRAWLNNEFYNTAFTALQQELIQTTNVDNSVYSTGYSSNYYACANFNDKIFLPSYREMVNTAYGFSSNSSDDDTARIRLTSDYSRATGVWMNTNTTYYGNGYWWLRSPYYNDSIYAWHVLNNGLIYDISFVSGTYFGVVPALVISLP